MGKVKKEAIIIQKPKAQPIFTGPRLEIEMNSGSLKSGYEICDLLVNKTFEKLE